jgi:hypothetical protein
MVQHGAPNTEPGVNESTGKALILPVLIITKPNRACFHIPMTTADQSWLIVKIIFVLIVIVVVIVIVIVVIEFFVYIIFLVEFFIIEVIEFFVVLIIEFVELFVFVLVVQILIVEVLIIEIVFFIVLIILVVVLFLFVVFHIIFIGGRASCLGQEIEPKTRVGNPIGSREFRD